MSTFYCKDCGVVVERVNSNQKRCASCQKAYNHDRRNEWRRERYKKYKPNTYVKTLMKETNEKYKGMD